MALMCIDNVLFNLVQYGRQAFWDAYKPDATNVWRNLVVSTTVPYESSELSQKVGQVTVSDLKIFQFQYAF
jgi:hypothetical protein